MSERQYNFMLAKWKTFLENNDNLIFSVFMEENEVDEQYDLLVSLFCKKHGYVEITKNMAFYDKWYDTFADEYYGVLEKQQGVKIVHDNPSENDWDFGKKFQIGSTGLEEIIVGGKDI